MTTISAATSTSTYSYTKNSTTASDDIASSILVSPKKATTTDQADDDTSSSAEKLVAQLMALAMSQCSSTQSSDESGGGDAALDVASMDSDSDGLVSRSEFVDARPSDVTEDQAGVLFDSFDSESTGSLSVDALSEAMASRPSGPGGPPPSDDSDDDDDPLEALFETLDANGDGVATSDEFSAGMSSDTRDAQARELFDFLSGSSNGEMPSRPPADDGAEKVDGASRWSAGLAGDEALQSASTSS